METLGITLNTDNNLQAIEHINEPDHTDCESDRQLTTLKSKFHKLFTTSHTVKNVEVDIQLKDEAKLILEKSRPIPIHLQQAVDEEIEKLKKTGPRRKSRKYRRTLLCKPP